MHHCSGGDSGQLTVGNHPLSSSSSENDDYLFDIERRDSEDMPFY